MTTTTVAGRLVQVRGTVYELRARVHRSGKRYGRWHTAKRKKSTHSWRWRGKLYQSAEQWVAALIEGEGSK